MNGIAVLALVAMVLPVGSAAPPVPVPRLLSSPGVVDIADDARAPAAARLLFVGDVMVGRNVAPAVAADPGGVFAGVAGVLRASDLTAGNLESPLTPRPHLSPNPYALEAPPGHASALAGAGFDLMTVANNHSGDAGRASIEDTWRALGRVGVLWAGAGPDLASAWEPVVVDVGGVRAAFLAVDGSRAGVPAGRDATGIAHWDAERVAGAVVAARMVADVVVVSIHGGMEYLTLPDRYFADQVDLLVEAGADVVWGHGPHVRQPVEARGRQVVASSLGNFLFDQPYPGTTEGALLEVLAGPAGVIAYRVGDSHHGGRRVVFDGWRPPTGDAVLLAGGWWELLVEQAPVPAASQPVAPPVTAAPVLRALHPDGAWLRCGSGAVTVDPGGEMRGWSWTRDGPVGADGLRGGSILCGDVDGDGRSDPIRIAGER